jgi:hypothetical protein
MSIDRDFIKKQVCIITDLLFYGYIVTESEFRFLTVRKHYK